MQVKKLLCFVQVILIKNLGITKKVATLHNIISDHMHFKMTWKESFKREIMDMLICNAFKMIKKLKSTIMTGLENWKLKLQKLAENFNYNFKF